MTTQKSAKSHSASLKTFASVSLSVFYFAMLAWPFGLTETGYMASRAFMAGAVMFAISIPAWIINIKRELYCEEATVVAAETDTENGQVFHKIGQAVDNES